MTDEKHAKFGNRTGNLNGNFATDFDSEDGHACNVCYTHTGSSLKDFGSNIVEVVPGFRDKYLSVARVRNV